MMVKLRRIVKLMVSLGLMMAFLGCAGTQTRESTGQYVDDSVITTKVKAAILDDLALKGLPIKVETYQGTVQLSGFVDTAQHANQAGELARGVAGVVKVKNDLIVK